MEPSIIEWAQLAPDLRVIATPERAWLHHARVSCPRPGAPASSGTTFAGPRELDAPARERRTRNLLDGAVAAAFGIARPETVPPLTPLRWVWRLAGLYHLTHSTPALLNEAARRFTEQGNSELARWATTRAREEHLHDLLALRDLKALGYDPLNVVTILKPAPAMQLLAAFEASVRGDAPVDCLGYAYALERLAMTVDGESIRRVESVLPPGVRATRCLRVHSAVGSDEDHVEDTIRVLAGRPAAELRRVALMAYRTSRLCFETPAEGHPDDTRIAALLAAS